MTAYPGDLIETGVWRGGATIFMRAILKARGVTDRLVWVADSFAGLPPPDTARYPQDEGITLHQFPQLAVPLERVQDNFRRYGLLDEQVRFLKGWFRDTLPTAPIERLAILRLDGDLYESTIQALDSLYHKLSVGGFVIVDDYGNVAACRQAVHDFRAEHGSPTRSSRLTGAGSIGDGQQRTVNEQEHSESGTDLPVADRSSASISPVPLSSASVDVACPFLLQGLHPDTGVICGGSHAMAHRLLFASIHSYVDPSSGAALATRESLELLATRGWDCRALTCGVLDYQNETPLEDVLATIERPASRAGAALSRGGEAEVFDLELDGVRVTLLPTAYSRAERAPSPREGAQFLDLADQVLDRFRPEVLLTYGGHPVCRELMHRARTKGTAVVFHLAQLRL